MSAQCGYSASERGVSPHLHRSSSTSLSNILWGFMEGLDLLLSVFLIFWFLRVL